MTKAKLHSGILLWDIETLPLEVTTWQLYKPRLSHENIKKEWNIATAAWKWLDQKEVYSAQVDPKRPRSDKALIRELWDALCIANVLVGHNADKFDLRKFNARAIFYRLDPLPPISTIDTLKIARKYFGFTSNRLDYLGRYLFGEGKIHTEYDLWLSVLGRDPEALKKMVAYNKHDVVLLEKVYKAFAPYIRNHPNRALMNEGELNACPACGAKDYAKHGIKYYATRMAQRYQCKKCRHLFSGNYKEYDETKNVS